MNYNDVYGGPFLKADDMPDRPVNLVIKEIQLDTFEDRQTHEQKKQLVAYFHGTDKRLGLNKTNCDRIAYQYGPDTEGWIDKQITLVLENVQAFGKIQAAIRVTMPQPAQSANRQPAAAVAAARTPPPATPAHRPSSSVGSPFDSDTPDLSAYQNEPISNSSPDFDDDIPF